MKRLLAGNQRGQRDSAWRLDQEISNDAEFKLALPSKICSEPADVAPMSCESCLHLCIPYFINLATNVARGCRTTVPWIFDDIIYETFVKTQSVARLQCCGEISIRA